jgi:hypothetical protein
MDPSTIQGALALAGTIVNAIVANAPAIIADVEASAPYVHAIAGMIQGTNATMEEITTLLTAANISSAQFETPLPVDTDGSTET